MNSILSLNNKAVLSSLMLAAMVSLVGCGKYGATSTDNTTEIVEPAQVELAAPSISYLDVEMTVDSSGLITAEQWLQAAQIFYKDKKYSKALRAAEESLAIKDSKQAYEIALLSAINITQSNMDMYNKPDVLSDSDKQVIKNRLTKVTTAINSIEYSENKSGTK